MQRAPADRMLSVVAQAASAATEFGLQLQISSVLVCSYSTLQDSKRFSVLQSRCTDNSIEVLADFVSMAFSRKKIEHLWSVKLCITYHKVRAGLLHPPAAAMT